MDFNSTNSTNSTNPACNMPSATVSGTDSMLGLSLMGTLDDDAILSLCSSSTLDLGESWALAALLAPWTESDFQNYASNAFKPEIPSTQNGLCAQVQPHFSLSVPSPATTTESLSPFNLAHMIDSKFSPAGYPIGYPAFAFQSPATMGQNTALPFLVGSPSPAAVIAHAVQGTTHQTLPGIFAPCNAAASLVCHPTASSAKASPVQAPSTAVQGEQMRQGSLFTRASTSAGQPLSSPPAFPGTLSALHSNASLYPLPASASLPVLPRQESQSLPNRAGGTALPRSVSLPGSLKMCGCTCHQGVSSIEETATVSGGLMHPSLIQPVPAVKVTVESTSLHLRTPRMSAPASLQTNHHNAYPASATSAKSSPSVTISPLISITNALNTASVSDVAEEVAPTGMRIRKTGLKRTHACDQCPQTYVRAEHLRRHVKSKHLGLKEHACSVCDFRCSRSDNLRLHMRTMHDA